MGHRRQAGKATGQVLFLLVLVAAAGGWNYHRNWQLEKEREGARPFERYATADLEALREAYASELEGVQSRFDAARRQRARPQGDRGSIAGNVDQFARTTRTSRGIREAAAQLAERQEQIEQLDRELGLRSDLGEGLMLHLKRLTTI